MHYLVTGGAGYIGSHLVRALIGRGDKATILDDFSTGNRRATQNQPVIEVDLRDLSALKTALAGKHFDGVFHFAAKSLVGESQNAPIKYYQNNIGGTANLIEIALDNTWTRFVLSSTAAVYGNPLSQPIAEDHPTQPINVYGRTKLAMEELLRDVCNAHDFSAICLRYFNAAGAATDASIGEIHEPETHLIPNALRATSGAGPALMVFGNDYPTPDGTCIRDYIHVEDLADAHLRAMERLHHNTGFDVFNLGNGQGFSVNEVLSACKRATGKVTPHQIGARRHGDPSVLVADARRARQILGWEPQHNSLNEIVESAWRWECRQNNTD